MNQAEITAMATEAGLNSYRIAPGEVVAVWERFAALVAAKERDACAQECVAISVDYWMGDAQFEAATRCCNAIRARGTKEGA
jgi:hypothetical protein